VRKRPTTLHHNSAPNIDAHQTGAIGFNVPELFFAQEISKPI